MFNKYLIMGLIAASIASAFMFKLYIAEVEEHGKTIAQLQVTNDTLDAYITAVKDVTKSQVSMIKEKEAVTSKYLQTKRDLERLRNREQVIVAKPGLIELKINKAFNKQQNKLACVSGDSTLCVQ